MTVDRPQTEASSDQLDRSAIVDTLCDAATRFVGRRWSATEVVIGLTGKWGSGKSTILNFVEEKLSQRSGVFVVRFNPWIITGHNDLIDIYFKEITRQLGRSLSEKARELAREFDKYREGITSIADLFIPGSSILNKFPKIEEMTLNEKRANLERKLNQFDGAIVVIIDELDRVEDQDIRELARFVKAIGDLPNISYLIGYDHVRVQSALSGKGSASEGEEYLKKIVQVNVPIRPLMDYEVDAIIRPLLPEGFVKNAEKYGEEWISAQKKIEDIIETPRDLKRFGSTLSIYWNSVGSEVHPIDLSLFAVLASSSSDLRDFIVDNRDSFIDDPRTLSSRFEEMLGGKLGETGMPGSFDEKRFGKFRDIIETLFPRTMKRESPADFGRISRFENFMTLIFLGDPPFRLSRKEFEEFWANPRVDELETWVERGKLGGFPKRFEQLFPEVASENDEGAFQLLSSFVCSQGKTGINELYSFADEMRWSLVRVAMRRPEMKSRLQQIMRCLVGAGDFTFLPDLVRHHMFAFGLAEGFSPRDYPTILEQPDFEVFLAKELDRYEASIRRGTWMRDFADANPFYALMQGGRFGADLAEEMTSQIKPVDGLTRFGQLLLPEGHSVEWESIAKIVDVETVIEQLEKLTEEDGSLSPPLMRLLSALRETRP